MVAGWGGFARFGLLPPSPGETASAHGALLVSGAIGTLIGIERAIASQRRWPFLAPALSAAGGIALVVGAPAWSAALVVLAAAAVLFAVAVVGAPSSPGASIVVMAAGAASWAIGALVWSQQAPAFRAVPWWTAFLVLTITAERMELTRALRPSRPATAVVLLAAATFALGTALTLIDALSGTRVAGAGALVLALWLLLRDRPPKASSSGLPRFIGRTISVAYAWLAVGALYMLAFDGVPSGWRYDAMVHAIVVGFVLSMIFAHAPIVLPAVLGVTMTYRRALYVPLALLVGSVVLRVAGDIVASADVRNAGAVGTGFALAAFGATMATSVRRRRNGARAPR